MKGTQLIKSFRPKLVTFDVTGTLLTTQIDKHYAEVASQHDIIITNPDILAPSFKQHFKRLSIEHPVFGKHSGLGWENWWKNLVHNVYKDQNEKIPPKKLDQVAENLIQLYATERCWQKYPGVDELLNFMNESELIIGVISNFDERLEGILINTGIRKYFSFVLTSWEHGKEKPDSSIFQKALKLGEGISGKSILPHEALHIGDNVKLDYMGAKNAGWDSILMQNEKNSVENSEKFPQLRFLKNLDQLRIHFEESLKLKN